MDESSAQWINLLISVNSIQKSSLSLQNAYKLEYSPSGPGILHHYVMKNQSYLGTGTKIPKTFPRPTRPTRWPRGDHESRHDWILVY